MTHNHALDQRFSARSCSATIAWFGLIGSSKRMRFEHRLHERGISLERLADMVCPIGIPGIVGEAGGHRRLGHRAAAAGLGTDRQAAADSSAASAATAAQHNLIYISHSLQRLHALSFKDSFMAVISFSNIDQSALQAYRASVLHFHADPAHHADAYAWHEDGLLLVADGKVVAAGDTSSYLRSCRPS